jgi:uncharacterized protein
MGCHLEQVYNQDLQTQISALTKIISESPMVNQVIERAEALAIADYYIGAGCITQTVWNYLSGFSPNTGISDIDFVYYDSHDLSFAAEDIIIKKAGSLFGELGVKIDVKNQARVHLWYEQRFGYTIKQYQSLEAAINAWPTTATAIGVRKINHQWRIYAPFGLNDLFGKVVRANKVQITKAGYEQKVQRWSSVWNDLQVIPWDRS